MIEIKNLRKEFGARVLFQDLNATFLPGTLSVLLGKNGAGKSTLLRILGGMAMPTSGEVISDHRPEQIGYIGHATFLYPSLTAAENLAFWLKATGQKKDEERISAILQHVGLAAFEHSQAGVFSRGMAQRLSLARVLLLNASLYLLDEPETGLDSASTRLLEQEIVAAKERGACVIWVTHAPERAKVFADRVYVLQKKQLLCQEEQG